MLPDYVCRYVCFFSLQLCTMACTCVYLSHTYTYIQMERYTYINKRVCVEAHTYRHREKSEIYREIQGYSHKQRFINLYGANFFFMCVCVCVAIL